MDQLLYSLVFFKIRKQQSRIQAEIIISLIFFIFGIIIILLFSILNFFRFFNGFSFLCNRLLFHFLFSFQQEPAVITLIVFLIDHIAIDHFTEKLKNRQLIILQVQQ